ncbi:sensor histidine kinase [Pseudoduganella plicata]|nr:histidine kinase [Pseudoduganella plicata]GGY94655.1 hypothetical protein GCM10007388_29910 [Pseudoduganella plicata]
MRVPPLSLYAMTPALPARRPLQITPCSIAVGTCALFAFLHVAAILAAGPGETPLHNPVGLAVLAVFMPLTTGATEAARMLPLFQAYAAAKLLVVLAMTAAVAGTCRPPARHRPPLLAAQLLCVTILDALPFHLLLAVQLAMLLPWRRGLAWLAAQYLLGIAMDVYLVLDLAQRMAQPPQWPLLAYLSAERLVLAAGFLFGHLVQREHRMRHALASAHGQLLATQSLLTETVRGAERLRIARDLHDVLGHHLTALNLHLDLAARQAGAAAPAALQTARDVSVDLLAQVRGVVTHHRHDQTIDVAEALRVLCAGVPSPHPELHIDADAARLPAPVAHALFCSIQEAITNALRHARASRLTVHLSVRGGMTVARVADDGVGMGDAAEGNGLRGMRERLTDLQGDVRLERGIRGTVVELSVPGSPA